MCAHVAIIMSTIERGKKCGTDYDGHCDQQYPEANHGGEYEHKRSSKVLLTKNKALDNRGLWKPSLDYSCLHSRELFEGKGKTPKLWAPPTPPTISWNGILLINLDIIYIDLEQE